jgi:uncharacterized membrane protein YvlD (DUF360 family)
VITAAVLLLRLNIPVDFGVRPMLILFMLPIVLCALLGGLGPGLFATALTALATDLMAEPHFHSTAASAYVQLQWASLVLNGVGVSLLSALLRQSLAKQEVNRRLLDAVVSAPPTRCSSGRAGPLPAGQCRRRRLCRQAGAISSAARP